MHLHIHHPSERTQLPTNFKLKLRGEFNHFDKHKRYEEVTQINCNFNFLFASMNTNVYLSCLQIVHYGNLNYRNAHYEWLA